MSGVRSPIRTRRVAGLHGPINATHSLFCSHQARLTLLTPELLSKRLPDSRRSIIYPTVTREIPGLRMLWALNQFKI